MRTGLLSVVHFLVMVLFAGAMGCGSGNKPPPPPVNTTPDEEVLLVLDYYNPMYKVDADGRVTHLKLNQRHLPIPILAEIGKLTELQKLDLYGASVTDDGLAQLKDLQILRNFGLGGTQITDKGLVHLEKLQSLQHVWLPKNRISKAGAEKLKDARPDLKVYLQ